MAEIEIVVGKKTKAMSPQTRTTLLICAAALGVVLGGFLIWWHDAEPSTSRYEPIIKVAQQHQLRTDFSGHVNLSRDFPGITPRDEMMVTYRSDDSFILMFPTKYGESTQVTGLLYTSRAMVPEDTHMRHSAINFDERLIDVGSYSNLLIDRRINEHWYHVSYHMR